MKIQIPEEFTKQMKELQDNMAHLPSIDSEAFSQIQASISTIDIEAIKQIQDYMPEIDFETLRQFQADMPELGVKAIEQIQANIPNLDLEAIEQIQANLSVNIRALLQSGLEPTEVEHLTRRLTESFVEFESSFRPVLERAQSVFASSRALFKELQYIDFSYFTSNFEELISAYTSHCKSLKELSKVLGQIGWYFDFGSNSDDFDNYLTFCSLNFEIEEFDVDIANNALCSYFNSRITNIEEELVRLLPDRKRQIEAGFLAHRNKQFIFSIPLLLIVIDGIGFDKTGKNVIFSRDHKTGQTRIAKLSVIPQDIKNNLYLDAMYSSLLNTTAINSPESEEDPEVVNRHRLLHGKDLSYDNEINSLKVISFLNYITGILYGWISYQKTS